jgi:hypothetical protein
MLDQALYRWQEAEMGDAQRQRDIDPAKAAKQRLLTAATMGR